MLGDAILQQLIDAGFTVTVFSRTANFVDGLPSGARAVQVDYSSVESLVSALQGQDVVVSTVGTPGVSAQKTIIDAAIQAGVKRFIPSDWGSLSTDPSAISLPNNKIWVDIQNYLKKRAAAGDIEYTLFGVGPFLEYVINTPFVVDSQNHTVDLYDGGGHPFSTTSLSSIGKAVSGALKNAAATKNRLIRVHDIVVTQSQVLGLAKKYSAPDAQWTENAVDATKELEAILSTTKQGDLDVVKWIAILKAAIFGGKFAGEYKPSDNELVGLPILSWEDFEALFVAKFGSAANAAMAVDGKFDGIQH